MHSGIACLPDGTLVVAHPEGSSLIKISPDGQSSVIPTPLTEMHCIVASRPETGPRLWIADNGHRFVHQAPKYGELRRRGRAVALNMQGHVVQELPEPQKFGPWSPTAIALAAPNDPGSDIWVADGYAQSLVHRYRADGTLQQTLDGLESGVRFSCPHGLLIRGTGTQAELHVADRSNRRIVVYDLDGNFRRTYGADVLTSPSMMAELDGKLFITELFGSIAVFDGDRHVGHIGKSARSHDETSWPNLVAAGGRTIAPDLTEGTFNSPHGIVAFDRDLYVTEWVIGGRVLRLQGAEPSIISGHATNAPSSRIGR